MRLILQIQKLGAFGISTGRDFHSLDTRSPCWHVIQFNSIQFNINVSCFATIEIKVIQFRCTGTTTY
jgi:hypothetical protein